MLGKLTPTRRRVLSWLVAASAVIAIAAPLPVLAEDNVPSLTTPIGQTQWSSIGMESSRNRFRRPGHVPVPAAIALDNPSDDEFRHRGLRATRPDVPRRIGIARDLAQLTRPSDTAARLTWEGNPDGSQTAAVTLTSPGARGLRIGIQVGHLPDNAVFRFYGSSPDDGEEVGARQIHDSIRRNLDSGADATQASIFWSPLVESESVTVEVELPPGTDPRSVELSIPRLSHFYATPINPRAGTIGLSEYCEVDVSCSSGWSVESSATARMDFVDETGTAWMCSGTLLNSASGDRTPYFLSAYHCVANQISASSVETWWFYKSASCNSSTVDSRFQRTGGGATLLYANQSTDTSFMRLLQSPPGGVTFAGWSPNPISTGTSVAGLHHPSGDLQKITQASVDSFADCTTLTTQDIFYCYPSTQAAGGFIAVVPRSGIWEGGSSGSGLFANIGGSHYLVGQLYGGTTTCSAPADPGFFGRFDTVYPSLARWLQPAGALTLAVTASGNGTVTSLPTGISCGSTCSAPFGQGTTVTLAASAKPGATFSGWAGACTGASPICQFAMNAAKSVTANFAPVPSAGVGVLGTPVDGSTVSGVGVISGYHCTSKNIEVFIDGSSAGNAGAGTRLLGTQGVCGRTDTGYSLLYNFNNLSNGLHVIAVKADGIALDSHTVVTYQSGGQPWLAGASRSIQLTDFPQTGQTAKLDWIQSYQNFVVTRIDDGSITIPTSTLVGSLTVASSGSGRITSAPAGIDCGSSCSKYFTSGTPVSLAASASPGWVFTGWSGSCAGAGPLCQLSVSQNETAVATFSPVAATGVGVLGTPVDRITVSGVGTISGYHCTSKDIDVYIDGVWAGKAGAGTRLLGTQGVCGRTDTGYSILYNFNNLSNGLHVITVSADGVSFDSHVFNTVQSGGIPWLTGMSRTVSVADFPTTGVTSVLQWVQSYQNFLLIGTR